MGEERDKNVQPPSEKPKKKPLFSDFDEDDAGLKPEPPKISTPPPPPPRKIARPRRPTAGKFAYRRKYSKGALSGEMGKEIIESFESGIAEMKMVVGGMHGEIESLLTELKEQKTAQLEMFQQSTEALLRRVLSEEVKSKIAGEFKSEITELRKTIDETRERISTSFLELLERSGAKEDKSQQDRESVLQKIAIEEMKLKTEMMEILKAETAKFQEAIHEVQAKINELFAEIEKQKGIHEEFSSETRNKISLIAESQSQIGKDLEEVSRQNFNAFSNALQEMKKDILENEDLKKTLTQLLNMENKVNFLTQRVSSEVLGKIAEIVAAMEEIVIKRKREEKEREKIKNKVEEFEEKILPIKYIEETVEEVEAKLGKTSEYQANLFLCLKKLEKIESVLADLRDKNKESEARMYSFSVSLTEFEARLSCVDNVLKYLREVIEKNHQASSREY